MREGIAGAAAWLLWMAFVLMLSGCSPRTTFDCTGDDDPGYACPAWGK